MRFPVSLVRHKWSSLIHREDCSAKGYSFKYDPWAERMETIGLVRGLNIDEGLMDYLVDRAIEEKSRFCLRCLPDLQMQLIRTKSRHLAARRLGVTT